MMEVGVDKSKNRKRRKGGQEDKRSSADRVSEAGVVGVGRTGDLAVSDATQDQDAPPSPNVVGKKMRIGDNARTPPTIKFEFHFPEEVWLMILDLVSDDEDKVSCCRAFPYLDRILTASKPVFLGEQVLPFMTGWLSKNELLTSRMVCKSWCVGIEKLMYERQTGPAVASGGDGVLYMFQNEEQVDKFMVKFAKHSRNPFVDRSISIFNGDGVMQPNYEEYFEKLLNLLRRFGRYIKIMDISEFLPQINLLTWYRFLQKALKFTPHLRQLRILEQGLLREPEEFVPQENINQLNSYMIQNPMPFVQALDVLYVHNGPGTNHYFENMHTMILQPYAGQLKILCVDAYNWKDHYAPGLVNLTDFRLAHVQSDAVLERLTQLPTTPLKSLTLEMTGDVSVPVLLRVLNHFPMLTEALFYFESVYEKFTNGHDISNLDHLKVPTIRSLEIYDGGTVSHNFLQLFTGLRRLIICLSDEMDIEQSASIEGEKEGDLQLFKIVKDGKIYESNIWEMIPTLKCFKISKENDAMISGTRECYNNDESKKVL